MSFESPEVLAARAMLYRFLQAAFGDQVSIEEPISEGSQERADCVVSLESSKAAYFVVPKQIRREREAFIERRRRAYRHVHWILMPRLLKKAPGKDKEFLLPTTHRDLASRRGVENLYSAGRHAKLGSLYYLYEKYERLVVLRGLECVHPPNVFRMSHGLKLDLEHVVADTRTGQLMSVEERDELVEWKKAEELRKREEKKKRLEAEERKRERQRERAAELEAMKVAAAKARKKAAERAAARVAERPPEPYGHKETAPSPPRPGGIRALNCLECGQRVTEWVYEQFDGCVCTRCHQRPAIPHPISRKAERAPATAESHDSGPHHKELRCLQCGTTTRNWVRHAYPREHPDGVCLCANCHRTGLDFPYDTSTP